VSELTGVFEAALQETGGLVKEARDMTETVKIIRDICELNKVKSVVLTSRLCDNLELKSALTNDRMTVSVTSELIDRAAVKTIAESDLGITDALVGIAETGTVAIVTELELDRLVSALPPTHIVLLERNRLIRSIYDLTSWTAGPLKGKNCTLSLITGPSSTADIEEILVHGVHGPSSFWVILIGGTAQ